MANQNEFYYIAVDENGQPYIEHGLLQNIGKKAHKYIMKIGEGAKARYFYTKEEVDAYYNKTKNKASDALKKTTQTAKKVSGNVVSSVHDAADSVADTGKKVASNVKSKVDRMKDDFKKRNSPPATKLSDPNEKIITEDIITEEIIPETILTETREIENRPTEIREIETKPIETKEIEIKKAPVSEKARHRPDKIMTEDEIKSSIDKAKDADKGKIQKPESKIKSGAKLAEQNFGNGRAVNKELEKKSQGTHLLDLSWNEVEDLRSRIYSVRNSAEDSGRTAIVNAANDIYDKLGRDGMTVEEAYAELQKLENNMKKKPTVKDSKSVTTFDNSSNIKTWN